MRQGVLAGSHVFDAITASKQWFLSQPFLGVVYYCAAFSLASAVMFPYGPFCVSIGYIFGFWRGLWIQSLAVFISSAFCYFVATWMKMDRCIDQWLQPYESQRKFLEVLQKDHLQSLKINVLLCFVPMPYGAHVYLFACTKYPFWRFVTVFEIGMLGHTIMNLVVGEALMSGKDREW